MNSVLQRTINEALKAFTPPPKFTVSTWADNCRYLSAESAAEPGKWRTSRAPYQRGMMDAVNEKSIEKVVLMTSWGTVRIRTF